jgi:hypothetical protein
MLGLKPNRPFKEDLDGFPPTVLQLALGRVMEKTNYKTVGTEGRPTSCALSYNTNIRSHL